MENNTPPTVTNLPDANTSPPIPPQQTEPTNPVQPPQPQKSKKLVVMIAAVFVGLLFLGGIVYAALSVFANPEKKAQEAFINTLEAKSVRYTFTTEISESGESVKFVASGEYDGNDYANPKLSATMDLNYSEGSGVDLELAAGMLAIGDDLYIKVDGLAKLAGLYQATSGVNIYEQFPSSAEFVQIYDDMYVRISQADIDQLATKIPIFAFFGDIVPETVNEETAEEDREEIIELAEDKTFFTNIQKRDAKEIAGKTLDGYSVQFDDVEVEEFLKEVLNSDIASVQPYKTGIDTEAIDIDTSDLYSDAEIIVYLDGGFIAGIEIIPTGDELDRYETFTLLLELTDYNQDFDIQTPSDFKTIVQFMDDLNIVYGGTLYTQINELISGYLLGGGLQSTPSLEPGSILDSLQSS